MVEGLMLELMEAGNKSLLLQFQNENLTSGRSKSAELDWEAFEEQGWFILEVEELEKKERKSEQMMRRS